MVDSVCALGIALISKPALSPQTWWYLRDEALDLISAPLTKSSPTAALQWWVCMLEGTLSTANAILVLCPAPMASTNLLL